MRIQDKLPKAPSSTLKLILLAGLVLGFLIPLNMVRGVIYDRMQYKSEAEKSISDSWAGRQRLTGPVVIIPYKKREEYKTFDAKTQTYETEVRLNSYTVSVLPHVVTGDVQIQTEERYKGIYKIPVYTARVHIKGDFEKLFGHFQNAEPSDIIIGKPYLSMGIQDVRGIAGDISISWNGKRHAVQAGSRVPKIGEGVHVFLPELAREQSFGRFDITFDVKGIKQFDFVPMGEKTDLRMTSNWSEPSFQGRFLPSERSIAEDGFSALWQTSDLATNILQHFETCQNSGCQDLVSLSYGVSLYKSVDVYQ